MRLQYVAVTSECYSVCNSSQVGNSFISVVDNAISTQQRSLAVGDNVFGLSILQSCSWRTGIHPMLLILVVRRSQRYEIRLCLVLYHGA